MNFQRIIISGNENICFHFHLFSFIQLFKMDFFQLKPSSINYVFLFIESIAIGYHCKKVVHFV